MSESLQDFSNSQYERPTQSTQIVGIGSDSSEHRLTERTLRKRRQIFTLSVTAFSIGWLLILLQSDLKHKFFAPGPLTSQHANILHGAGAEKCSACHDAGDKSLSNWISRTFTGNHAVGATQPELCMKCHTDSMNAEFALNPHNVDPTEMKKISAKYQNASFARIAADAGLSGLVSSPTDSQGKLACNACHREHHGLADLTRLTDRQCQTCHTAAFDSFEEGHPEFTNYPASRRSRIAFDHVSHGITHFNAKGKAFDCSMCHVDDQYQNVKKLVPYAQSCAECHDQQVRESSSEGLALFALPMLDVGALKAANLDVGSWPESATGDFDGSIPPIMKTMLMADPTARSAFEQLGDDFEFSDVNPEDSEQISNVFEVVWSIKFLLHELSLEGSKAIGNRLSHVLNREVTEEQLYGLVADLNEPVFQNAVRRWLPNLNVEVAKKKFGKTKNISWFPNNQIHAFHRSTADKELLATNPLKGLLQPSQTNIQSSSQTNQPPVKQKQPVAKNSNDFVPAQQAQSNSRQNPGKAKQQVASSSPQGTKHQQKSNSTSIRVEVQGVPDEPDRLAVNPLKGMNAPDFSVANDEPVESVQPESTVREQWVAGSDNSTSRSPFSNRGAWVRDDVMMQISYQPGGHADECVKNWSDLVVSIPDSEALPETRELFEELSSPSGVGLCRSCHTMDKRVSNNSSGFENGYKINWEPEYRDPSIRSFTRFSHGPHLLQPSLQDCTHCHEMDENQPNAQSFISFDPQEALSNFKPIKMEDCSSCHAKGQTESSCTQCHSYHVGSKVIGR